MGGNLYGLPRMLREQYLQVENKVRNFLDQFISGNYKIPRYYPNKADFGDMDVLIRKSDREILTRKLSELTNIHTPTKGVGGSFLSSVVDGLQVDFFFIKDEDLESTSNFMDYGEVGNIIGRMTYRMNLKFGMEGLSYVFRHGEHYQKEFLLTKNFEAVCKLLHLDYALWASGFPNRNSMFNWIIQSPYFDSSKYLDDESKICKRAQERPYLKMFIQFVRRKNIPPLNVTHDGLTLALLAFPEIGLETHIDECIHECWENDQITEKFNGKAVMNWTGLQGKELGLFMRDLKQVVSREELLSSSPEEIHFRVMQNFNKRQAL